MHADYIDTRLIREVFNRDFYEFNIVLPKPLYVFGSIKSHPKWSVDYGVGENNSGKPCVYFYASSSLAGPEYFAIDETGATTHFATVQPGFRFDSAIPGDRKRKLTIHEHRNRYGMALFALQGGNGYMAPEIGDVSYCIEGDQSPFSLWHACAFKALGLDFTSSGQYMGYLLNLYAGNRAAAARMAMEREPEAQKALWREHHPEARAFADFRKPDQVKKLFFEVSKYKILQDKKLLEALCAIPGWITCGQNDDDLCLRSVSRELSFGTASECLGGALGELKQAAYQVYKDPIPHTDHYVTVTPFEDFI